MKPIVHIADVDRPDTWTRYRAGLCSTCAANCCTMPLEVRLPDMRARLAVDVFVHRIVREVGGLDGLVFTAGTGERAAEIRARVYAASAGSYQF